MAADATSPFEQLVTPSSCETALAVLPAMLRSWFASRFHQPTTGQRLAWPAIAAGKHLLLCAPTGSGKTLAAFLPILGRVFGEPAADSVQVLYVAPLKAL